MIDTAVGEHIWYKSYAPGVKPHIDYEKLTSLKPLPGPRNVSRM